MNSNNSAFSTGSSVSCFDPTVLEDAVSSPAASVCFEDPFVTSTTNSINILKAELVSATTMAIQAPEGDEKMKLLESCKTKGELLCVLMATLADSKKVDATFGSPAVHKAVISNVVPFNLPLFQWEGHVFNAKAPIFVDVAACLQKFEDVMFAHNLDYDANFKRLIPACLSSSQRTWYDQYLSSLGEHRFQSLTWVMFKLAVTDHYGLTVDEDRSSAAVALIDIEMLKNESIDSFVDRFNNLRRRAVDQCPPASVLINKFLSALPANLHDKVTISKATLDKSKKNNLEVIICLVKDLSKELAKNKNKRSLGEHQDHLEGSKRSKWASSSSSSSSVSPASSNHAKAKKSVPSGLWCAFHKVKTHNTLDCRAASAASSALSSAAGSVSVSSSSTGSSQNINSNKAKSCYTCGVTPWTPKHKCNTARRNQSSVDEIASTSHYLGAMHLDNPPDLISFENPAQPSVDDLIMHEATPDAQSMIAQQSQLCKYNKYSQLPSHKSNSILIPVIIENVKTFAVIDTGASFSIVSPEFVSSLGFSFSLDEPSATTVSFL